MKMAAGALPAPAQQPRRYESRVSAWPPFSPRPHTPTTCLWRKTCCTRLQRRRGGDTRRSGLSRAQTLTSWMSNVQVAIRSPQCSAMLRQWCCV
ncbi:hypothetical protein PDJAM_G00009900 [Pangasius djambal]|uniref:Uncharacterized protein n=1 Tax=Pangasius djambal TaxID=1691987 RepID=A0ACC5XZN4_9TELE|nr:hypothetical protein [Pangasius djambal]